MVSTDSVSRGWTDCRQISLVNARPTVDGVDTKLQVGTGNLVNKVQVWTGMIDTNVKVGTSKMDTKVQVGTGKGDTKV